jgi:hypothetical protein
MRFSSTAEAFKDSPTAGSARLRRLENANPGQACPRKKRTPAEAGVRFDAMKLLDQLIVPFRLTPE